jgi:MFS transporter, DHA1 family, inner membrane transport protein
LNALKHPTETEPYNERLILFVLAAVQFITIVDFMIVMPLGPQLMRTLEIGPAAFGLVVSSYTLAAGLAGFVASLAIDRCSRRSAFLLLYAGFLIGTVLCGISLGYTGLVIARFATGAFGGILGGMSMAIIGDVFPEHRRGRATGALMTGFAVASVAGVPLGLVVGTNWGWQMAFIALALGGLPVLALAAWALPRLDEHLSHVRTRPLNSLINTFAHINHLNAFALSVVLTMSGFLVFPYMSAFFVGNVGMSEQQLPIVYIAGGVLTLIASPLVGRMADRHGKLLVFRVIAPISAVLLCCIPLLGAGQLLLAVLAFAMLMVCNVGRMIPAMAMITGSVSPRHRGAFLSANSSLQHIAGGLAASVGGLIVVEGADQRLENFPLVGCIAAIFAAASLWLAGRLRLADSSASEVDACLATETCPAADSFEDNCQTGESLVACAK